MNYYLRNLACFFFILTPLVVGLCQAHHDREKRIEDKIQIEIDKIVKLDLDLYETSELIEKVYFKYGVFNENNIYYKPRNEVIRSEEEE